MYYRVHAADSRIPNERAGLEACNLIWLDFLVIYTFVYRSVMYIRVRKWRSARFAGDVLAGQLSEIPVRSRTRISAPNVTLSRDERGGTFVPDRAHAVRFLEATNLQVENIVQMLRIYLEYYESPPVPATRRIDPFRRVQENARIP